MKRMQIAAGPVALIAVATAIPALAAGKSGPSALDGVYRISWTQQQLIAAGASPAYASHNLGVITMTMREGHFVWHQVPPPSCAGIYAVTGKSVSIRFTKVCTGSFKARWSLHAGQLRFLDVRDRSRDEAIEFGAKPWKKIGP
jgi:hypothetical protein